MTQECPITKREIEPVAIVHKPGQDWFGCVECRIVGEHEIDVQWHPVPKNNEAGAVNAGPA